MNMNMNEQEMLYRFLNGSGTDKYGRTHAQILSMSNYKLETTHNYIQWLFPIDEPSKYADSVVLTEEMIAAFKEDKAIMDNLHRSFDRMMQFYGFGRNERGKLVPIAPRWKMRIAWLNMRNHNFLRLTRILRCLHLFGLSELEADLYAVLESLAHKYWFLSKSYVYWKKAIQ